MVIQKVNGLTYDKATKEVRLVVQEGLAECIYMDATQDRTVKDEINEINKKIIGLPPCDVDNITAYYRSNKIIISWNDPEDTVVDDRIISWAGTKLIRKTGCFPEDENDGILVMTNSVRNQYSGSGFVDTGLENGTEYFYQLFPFSKTGVINRNEANRISAIPNELKRYGVRVADTESSPLMERLYDSIGMIANVGTSLSDNPTNDYDNVYPFNKFIEETINGRVMIRIPKFWVRREYYQEGGLWYRERAICEKKYDDSYVIHEMFLKGNVQYTGNNPESDYNDYVWVAKYETSSNNQSVSGAAIQVSQTRAASRNNAKAIGNGWSIMDIVTWSGLCTLFYVVFANRNSEMIMKGNYSDRQLTGETTGAVAKCVQVSNVAMSFYGIENLYTNCFKYLDGVNMNNYQGYVCTKISDYADDTSTNYRQVGYLFTSKGGHIKSLGYDSNNKFAEFPIAVGGSTTTYYCDYCYPEGGWIALTVGSNGGSDGNWGISCWVYRASSSANQDTGSRLVYRPF